MAEGSAEATSHDLGDVDEVWLGGETSMPGEEFVEALEAVQEMQDAVRHLKDEMADMDVGLTRDDAVALVYGRNYNLSKSQVESAFEVMDVVVDAPLDDIAPRLMAGKTGDLTISEAAEVWDDLVNLAEKYGAEIDNGDNP